MEGNNISVEKLGTIDVFDEQGETIHLAQLWADQPAVLVFVRHFG